MRPELTSAYLSNAHYLFSYYKGLADKAMAGLDIQQLNHALSPGENSISLIVKHLAGNMLSRWTDFLNSDGEKAWRNRDAEFEGEYESREAMLAAWEKGWACVFESMAALKPQELEQTVYIRGEAHLALEAINRQIAHYAYHVGQIVFFAKHLKGAAWSSLSIPKGESVTFNENKFGQNKI